VDVSRHLLRTARVVQAAEEVADAIKNCEAFLNREPTNATALHALGVLLNRRGDFERAVILLEQAVIVRSSDPTCHVDLGESYRNLGSHREAVGCCLTGLRLRPEYPEGWNTLGLALRGCGDLKGALEQFRQAITHQEDFFPAHINAALVLQELGDFGGAITHFLRAVELSPESCQVRTSLGLALQTAGQATEARIHFEEAVRLRPDLGVVYHNLGNSLRLLGQTGEARALYLKAIRLDPSLTLSYLHIGMTFRLEGSLGDALKWHQLAVEMEPEKPSFWEGLADLYQKRDEPHKAVDCRQRILKFSTIDRIGALVDLGWALQDDGRPDEALEQYAIARELQPDSAQVHFALAGVHEEQGKMSEAETEVRAAIRLRPHFHAAYSRLATLLRGKLPDDDLRTIEGLLAEPGLDSQQRARLLFAIAHVLDARQDYRRAAACLREANALTLEARRAEGVIYNPEDHDRFVEKLIGAFDDDFFRRTAGLGLGTRRPIFIIGVPRSGTTLVEQVLASHPRVFGAGERNFGRRSFDKMPAVVNPGEAPLDCVAGLDEYALMRLAGEHLAKLNTLDLGRFDRIVDKMPDNYLDVGLLAAMFPNAVFIRCLRDLRDVAVSNWMSDFRSVRWANDPVHIGSRFRRFRDLMGHWDRVCPGRIHDVAYEETVSDLEGVARRLIAACGLDWNPACLEFHQTSRVVRTASLTQVRQPIYTKSVARWKNYADDLGDLFALVGDDPPNPPTTE